MLWANHGPALTAIGGSAVEYYSEVRRQLQRFTFALRRSHVTMGARAKWAQANPV
jgi:hypothetical protein